MALKHGILVQPENFADFDDSELLDYDQALSRELVQAHKAMDLGLVDQLRASSQALAEYLSARALAIDSQAARMALWSVVKGHP